MRNRDDIQTAINHRATRSDIRRRQVMQEVCVGSAGCRERAAVEIQRADAACIASSHFGRSHRAAAVEVQRADISAVLTDVENTQGCAAAIKVPRAGWTIGDPGFAKDAGNGAASLIEHAIMAGADEQMITTITGFG